MHCYPPCIRHLVTLLINKCSDRSIRSFFPDRNCGHPPSPLGVLKCFWSLTSHRNNVSRSGRGRRACDHAGRVSLQDWEERNINLSFNFLNFNNFNWYASYLMLLLRKKVFSVIFCYSIMPTMFLAGLLWRRAENTNEPITQERRCSVIFKLNLNMDLQMTEFCPLF